MFEDYLLVVQDGIFPWCRMAAMHLIVFGPVECWSVGLGDTFCSML